VNLLAFLAIGIALGMALGLFGGGGGILAIPLLVAAGLPADEAGTTSLIVVGIGAIGGLIPHARAGRVVWAQGAIFGALGIIGALAGSTLALATNDAVQLWGFSVVLVVAGTLMLRKALRDPPSAGLPEPDRHRRSWALIVVTAAAVGLFTGFFGVGGGFLVVPALTLVMGMSMHRATATALLVIVINSAAGFLPRAGEALDIQVAGIVAVSVLVTAGLAARWSNRWSARSLELGFAILVLSMSLLTVSQAINA
jgi:uncharacterized membrane protein YfcA